MNAYRIPGRTEIDDVAAEARRDAKRLRLEERLRLIDALIGSPERAASGGRGTASALFAAPFVLAGAVALWLSEGLFRPFNMASLVGFGCMAVGAVVAWATSSAFRFARFITRRSLAKLC